MEERFLEMEEHEDKQETQTSQEYTEWTNTCWDHTDNWTDADWWSSDRSTDLWNDSAWEQAARQFPSTQPAQEEQSNPTHGGSISMSGGLMMCELSVNVCEQQIEQNDGDRNRYDDWNNRAENWFENEMKNDHKIENRFQKKDDE